MPNISTLLVGCFFKVGRVKGALAKAEAELQKWRGGETVNPEEQLRLEELDPDMPMFGSETNLAATSGLSPVDRGVKKTELLAANDFEREKMTLYAQLDEKVFIPFSFVCLFVFEGQHI